MSGTRLMWYAGTMLTAIAMLAASPTIVAPDQPLAPGGRNSVAEAQASLVLQDR